MATSRTSRTPDNGTNRGTQGGKSKAGSRSAATDAKGIWLMDAEPQYGATRRRPYAGVDGDRGGKQRGAARNADDDVETGNGRSTGRTRRSGSESDRYDDDGGGAQRSRGGYDGYHGESDGDDYGQGLRSGDGGGNNGEGSRRSA